MFRPLDRSRQRMPRRGTSFILIVVVMLSLFSAVGTAFALFAMREARLALARKDEQGGGTTAPVKPPDPTDTLNRFFSALVYDVGDDGNDLNNSLRGHSLARSMYGRDVFAIASNAPPTTPWNGVGLFREANLAAPIPLPDRSQQVNYTRMMIGNMPYLLDPEYTGTRPIDPLTGQFLPFDPTTRTYISKAAGYSYPDLKDFFLAQVDPSTGEVMVPSFHRPSLFGSLDPTNGFPVPPGNPPSPNNKWYNPEGRLQTLRPRPAEHPLFPFVPPDADGGYRGDVRNLPGGYRFDPATGQYYAINDSLWMDLGLPVITMPGNKRVKPMVAPLIIPLNGMLNPSVHGNTYFGGLHHSHSGFGPHEVSLAPVLGPIESGNVINARGFPQQRSTLSTRSFNPYSSGYPLPNYSPVAWDNSVVAVAYPQGGGAGSLRGYPVFNNFQTSNAAAMNHPSLFNPTEWPGTNVASNRVFPMGDIKRMHLRYAAQPEWYNQSELAPFARDSLLGNPAFISPTGVVANGQFTENPYRLDPSHYKRMLITTRSYDLDRPKVAPTYLTSTLRMQAGAQKPSHPQPLAPYPAPQATGPGSDFMSATRWVNALAALGSVDLNRPLADYRDLTAGVNQPIPQAISATNMANATRADADRRQLAHDIFVRLAAATGGAITINGLAVEHPGYQYTLQAGATPEQINALRYLAQLAVNIVDFIDNDDISTMFIWNPNNTGSADFTNAADVAQRVVFGFEKPRLVINEAYSEITNAPSDPIVDPDPATGMNRPLAAGAQAHIRFWLELVNPTATPTAGSPLGTGGVPLSAYRIEIARASRATTGTPYWRDYGNPTGAFDPTAVPDIVYTPGANAPTIEPNNANYNPAGVPANGVLLIAPQLDATQVKGNEFNPAQPQWNSAFLVDRTTNPPAPTPGSNSLTYTLNMPDANELSGTQFKRHVVFLRRLANPYAPAGNTNPYITVDMMDYLPSFDAVNRAAMQSEPREPRPAMNPMGAAREYDPIDQRFSIGRVQPYAGLSTATVNAGAGNYNVYNGNAAHTTTSNLTDSLTREQTPLNAGEPKHTFGRHNGVTDAAANLPVNSTFTGGATASLTDTIMLPFDWLPHMDRPLVNQIELFQVRDTPPHLVTTDFIIPTPGTAPGVTYEFGLARWPDVADGMARALEYLTVRPHIAGVPHGGRVPGKININALQDRRVLDGLFDPQSGNNFDSSQHVYPVAWQQWMNSRGSVTMHTLPDGNNVDAMAAAQRSVYDGVGGTDRPFFSFGTPAAGMPVTGAGAAFAYGFGGSIDNTILRRGPTGLPILYAGATSKPGLTYSNSLPNGPLYSRTEPVQKIMNNITTVNHQYVVYLTIGYFEVVADTLATGEPGTQLGPEAFINIPGDMRQKFVAVVDMSNMALRPDFPTVPGDPHATEAPFFTSLEQTAYATGNSGPITLNIASTRHDGTNLYVASDGQEIAVGGLLVIGYGTEQQIVRVLGSPGVGLVTVETLTGVPFRTAWGGTCVSNVRPGYPGPQPNFSYGDVKYKGVLPYIERVR